MANLKIANTPLSVTEKTEGGKVLRILALGNFKVQTTEEDQPNTYVALGTLATALDADKAVADAAITTGRLNSFKAKIKNQYGGFSRFYRFRWRRFIMGPFIQNWRRKLVALDNG